MAWRASSSGFSGFESADPAVANLVVADPAAEGLESAGLVVAYFASAGLAAR